MCWKISNLKSFFTGMTRGAQKSALRRRALQVKGWHWLAVVSNEKGQILIVKVTAWYINWNGSADKIWPCELKKFTQMKPDPFQTIDNHFLQLVAKFFATHRSLSCWFSDQYVPRVQERFWWRWVCPLAAKIQTTARLTQRAQDPLPSITAPYAPAIFSPQGHRRWPFPLPQASFFVF